MTSGLLGCEALVEATKAPFEASSELSQGTVEATSEFTSPTTDLTNPTREFTSVSLGLMDRTEPDGQPPPDRRRAHKKLETFTASAFENVRQDIARGGGEYLASVATLAGVPAARQPDFASFMHKSYGTLYGHDSRRDAWKSVVDAAWSAGYGQH